MQKQYKNFYHAKILKFLSLVGLCKCDPYSKVTLLAGVISYIYHYRNNLGLSQDDLNGNKNTFCLNEKGLQKS